MANDSSPLAGSNSVILSLDGAKRMVAERDDLARRLADAEKRVQALSLLLDEEAKRLVFGGANKDGEDVSVERPISLTMAIIKALEKAERGVTEEELAVLTGDFFNLDHVLSIEPDALHEAILRALRSSRIKKRRDRLYHPIIISRMERGIINSDQDALLPPKTLIDAVEHALSTTSGVVEAKAIIAKVRADDDLALKLNQNPQAAYTALTRLVGRGKARREEGG